MWGKAIRKIGYQKSKCRNDRCGEGDSMGGPEEISSGCDDVILGAF
jgi:hypothetical protein